MCRGESSQQFCEPDGRGPPPWHRLPTPSAEFGDVFPLPLVLERGGTGHGRAARRKAARRSDLCGEANDAICALNSMSGAPPWEPGDQVPDAHLAIHSLILRRISAGRPKSVPAPRAAAKALLGQRFDYLGSGSSVEPYNAETVSLQAGPATLVDIATALGPERAEMLNPTVMCNDISPTSAAPSGGIRPYKDEVFRKDRAAERSFIARLVKLGMIGVSRCRKGRITPFFVSKKNGKQRVVWDCRLVNLLFKDPPGCDMGGGEAVGHFESDGDPLYVAQGDVENCFFINVAPLGG